jgi:hypothetical protein
LIHSPSFEAESFDDTKNRLATAGFFMRVFYRQHLRELPDQHLDQSLLREDGGSGAIHLEAQKRFTNHLCDTTDLFIYPSAEHRYIGATQSVRLGLLLFSDNTQSP